MTDTTRAADTSEKHESLWLLAASPMVWAAHFLLSYGAAAIWCAKLGQQAGTPLGPVRVGIFVATAVALAAIAWVGLRARARHRADGRGRLPHDRDTALDRHRFLGFAVMLLSGLSAVAVVYSAMVVVFIGRCQ